MITRFLLAAFLLASPVQTWAATSGCQIGGKPVPEFSVSAFTAEQNTYIETTAAPRLLPNYIIYDSADVPGFLWHGAYMSIIAISLIDGHLVGATTRLREGWETNFPCYVEATLASIEKRL